MKTDKNHNTPGLVFYILVAILLLALMQATQPIQQQAPSYDGNTWQTIIINEDNDTNVCVGYCRDR